MNKTYIVKENDLTKVASAIRDKGGTTDSLVFPHEFNSAIQSINTQKPEQTKSVTYTANSSYNVTPDSGKVLSDVNVTVKVPNYTPKELNPIGINFISWNGDIVETWTLDELQKATELPTVPPTIKWEDITNIEEIYFAFPCWNTTLDDLKAANCPCNVGVCMDIEAMSEVTTQFGLSNLATNSVQNQMFIQVKGRDFTCPTGANLPHSAYNRL